jgi:hypothetical protein
MRFRSKGQPKGQMLAREQRRITLTIAGVGILFMLLMISGKSSWFTQLFSDPTTAQKKAQPVSEALMGNTELRPDEVEFVPTESPAAANDYASMIDRAGAAQMEATVPENTNGVNNVPYNLTRTIRDDVLGVLSTESDAWFGTLRMAQKITSEQQSRIPEGQFALFMDAPQSCRGRAFTIQGRLRRLVKAPLPKSAETYGVRAAYDAWISTRDSGNQLIHVVALSADSGLPLREELGSNGPDVELAGYFFKREGYAAKGVDGQGDLALAPLILAGRLRYLPPRSLVTRADEMNPWLMWVGITIVIGVLLLIWQFQISDNVFRGSRTHQLTSLPVRPSFDGVESVTIQQVLKDMQEHAQQTSPDTSLISR